jgi:multiple sugar transport system permease protein
MSIAGQRKRWWRHAVLIGTGTIILVPVIWVVLAGFRTQISLLMGEIMFRPVWSKSLMPLVPVRSTSCR